MTVLLGLSRVIDAITTALGKLFAWLILAAVLVSAGNAIVRKTFDTSSNAWLELQWYLFGAAFLVGAAWTLKDNEHIRIDVIAARFSDDTRRWIDIICHIIFLLPFTILMVWLSIPFALNSFAQGEISANAGGLILWPAKGLVLVGMVLLTAQGFSELIKSIAGVRHLPGAPEEAPHDSDHGVSAHLAAIKGDGEAKR